MAGKAQDIAGTVLVVEDEVLVACDIAAAIEGAGGRVVGPAYHVRDALELVAACPVDIAVLDVNLDGENVFSLADALYAKDIPFVFVTGHSTDVIPERFRGRPWLQKPYTLPSLLKSVAAVLQTSLSTKAIKTAAQIYKREAERHS